MRGPVEGGGVREEQERETPKGKTRGVPGAGSHLPSREDASCVSPGASSGHAWLQAGQLSPLCSSLLIPVGPNSLETSRAGQPDEGSLWGAPPGAAAGSTSSGELLVPRELRLDFPLLLRMIKAIYFKSTHLFLNHNNILKASKFKRYVRGMPW